MASGNGIDITGASPDSGSNSGSTSRSTSDSIGVGIIGYGSASKIFHAPLVRATAGLRLVAVSSSDATKVAADLPDVAIEANADALIARNDVDLVIIPTPNATHFSLAQAALLRGKHVVVDKPFTLHLADAQKLAALAAKHRRLLTVFHNRRWDADFLAVKGLIESGDLGRVSQFESTFHYYRPEPRERWRERAGEGGGLWNDLGPHLVDQALQLFGLPEAVYLDVATLREGGQTDDYFTAILRYPDKRAILRVNASAGLAVPRFVIQGSQASFSKYGIDPQEDALRAGQSPDVQGLGWGHDPISGVLTRHADGRTSRVATPAGNYPAFYTGVRDALSAAETSLTRASAVPVDLDSALAVMAILDLGRNSAAARAELPLA